MNEKEVIVNPPASKRDGSITWFGWVVVRIAVRAFVIMFLLNMLLPVIFPEMGEVGFREAFLFMATLWVIQWNPDTHLRLGVEKMNDNLITLGTNQMVQNNIIIGTLGEISEEITTVADVTLSKSVLDNTAEQL